MTHLGINPEVSKSKSKMETSIQISPRLGRANIMLNSFSCSIPNASEELAWAPKMPMSKVISQPGMLLHQFESTVSFEQLQCFADRHCWGQFNKQMDMVNSDVKLVNFTSMLESNFTNKSLAINFQPIKLERVHSIFNFPDKMESILSEGVFEIFQLHFISPQNIAHAKSDNLVSGAQQSLSHISRYQELNLMGEGNSSLGLKAEVSLPLM